MIFSHSTLDQLSAHASDLPFDVIADPAKRIYAQFGVESGRRALLDPRVWATILKAVGTSLVQIIGGKPMPSINPGGGRLGLPADFLIATNGQLIACKYGEHADDQWSVQEVIGHAREWKDWPVETSVLQSLARSI